MAFDPPPVPDLVLDSREVDQPIPQALVEKVDARKKKKKGKRRKKKKAKDSTIPHQVGGPLGYMSEAGIQKVYERRRRHGLSMDDRVSVTEFLEATEWRIPREMVHRSTVPKEVAKRPGRRRPAATSAGEKKEKAIASDTRRSVFLREVSDLTTFDPLLTRSTSREDRRPLVLDPVVTSVEDRGPLVLSPIGTRTSERHHGVDRGGDRSTSSLGQHLQYTTEEDRIQRTQPRQRHERAKPKRKPHRALAQDRIEKAQARDRKRIEKAATRAREKDNERVRRRQTQPRPRKKKAEDIWDLIQADTDYAVPVGGLPPPPSILSTRHTSSSQGSPRGEKTLDLSDFDESSKTTRSSQRQEYIREATKADKALLDRLLKKETQPPPLDYI